jgi:hypothetical protein
MGISGNINGNINGINPNKSPQKMTKDDIWWDFEYHHSPSN